MRAMRQEAENQIFNLFRLCRSEPFARRYLLINRRLPSWQEKTPPAGRLFRKDRRS
jgi:hypothetical protein